MSHYSNMVRLIAVSLTMGVAGIAPVVVQAQVAVNPSTELPSKDGSGKANERAHLSSLGKKFEDSGNATVTPARVVPESGYWWNPAEPGRGFVIEIQGNAMYLAAFLYTADGRATWVASGGAMKSQTKYSGQLIAYEGGQTLTGAYQKSMEAPAPVGAIAINFTSGDRGILTWPGGVVPIRRYDFVPSGSKAPRSASKPQTGWWWNENEGGRGFSLEVQNSEIYLVGHMYDSAGEPTWYVAKGEMTGNSLFRGKWLQYGDGQTLNGPPKPPSVINEHVGPVELRFIDPTFAILTLPDGRRIPLKRYVFESLSFPTAFDKPEN
jgi:hypothetical protein